MTQFCYVLTDQVTPANTGVRTAATGYTTPQTTSFSTLGTANYYATIYDAIIYNTLVDGDIVICADNHDTQYTVTRDLVFIAHVLCYSVSVDDLTVYSPGALEGGVDSGDDLEVHSLGGKSLTSYGVNFVASDDIFIDVENATVILHDADFGCGSTATAEVIRLARDGVVLELYNCAVKLVTGYIEVKGGSTLFMDGGSIDYSGTTASNLFKFAGVGGCTIDVNNSDLSSITAGKQIVDDMVYQDDISNIKFTRCKFPSSFILAGVIGLKSQTVDAYSCDDGDGYHYFEHHRYEGIAKEELTVKRTGGATYDGTNEFSAEFQPNANVVAYTQPLEIKIAEIELDLTSINTLTFHLAMEDNTSAITPSTITNDKYFIKLVQNSDAATSKALGITIDTKPVTILTTPTALDNVETTWTGRTATYQDEFQIEVDTVAVSGMTNGQVTAYLCVAEYVSTRAIFVCPSPVRT